MARQKKGIMGPFSGKVGNVVGSSWRGIEYIRSRPKRTKPPTPAELANRFLFAYTQQWLQPIAAFLKVGFKNYSPTVFGVNAAKSYLYANALTKAGFESKIHPELMKISIGTLPMPRDITVEKTGASEITFTWNTALVDGGNPSDQIMYVAYNVEDKDEINYGEVYGTTSGQFRSTGTDKLTIIPNPESPNLPYHIYVAFVADDRENQSDSTYLGTVHI